MSVILSPGDGRSVGRCCGRFGGFNLSKKEHLLFIESDERRDLTVGVVIEVVDESEASNKGMEEGIGQSSERDLDCVASACSRAKTEKFCKSLTNDFGKKHFPGQTLCIVGSEVGIWRSSVKFGE